MECWQITPALNIEIALSVVRLFGGGVSTESIARNITENEQRKDATKKATENKTGRWLVDGCCIMQQPMRSNKDVS